MIGFGKIILIMLIFTPLDIHSCQNMFNHTKGWVSHLPKHMSHLPQ